MGIIEFLLKVFISYLLSNEYKREKGEISGLFDFKYKERDELK